MCLVIILIGTRADPPFPLFILAAGAAYLGFLTHEVFNPLFTHPSNLTLGTLSAPSLLKLLPPATSFILLDGIGSFCFGKPCYGFNAAGQWKYKSMWYWVLLTAKG